jgi:radical SAM superfamily enzyme YgiQ (UPF0313 family)
MTSMYLISPAADFPSYFGSEAYAATGLSPRVETGDLAITTVAAMAPSGFEVALCDEHVMEIDFDTDAKFVGITGKISQWERMAAVAAEFRKRRKVVLIGGPFATLDPETVRPHCDILVRGEIEDIAPEMLQSLLEGKWTDEYIGTKPDLKLSPIPRWDLYPNERAISGTVQTSRGCPFECEFCDVIAYLGRKQRHKSIAQVTSELSVLKQHGYRSAFLADDNFTVYRSRAKELLDGLRHWNSSQSGERFRFTTQVSIGAAADDELLHMCAEAGLVSVFIGIETPNEESLRESKKRQNLRKNLVQEIQKFADHGIVVQGGMIVGFDADDLTIFSRQFDFAMSTPVPIYSLGLLTAPAATPLYKRLQDEGRLVSSGSRMAGMPWSTNIVPKLINRQELLEGITWLCNSLYRAAAFEERMMKLINTFGQARRTKSTSSAASTRRLTGSGPRSLDALHVISKIPSLGPREDKMLSNILSALKNNPEAISIVAYPLRTYFQIRYMYQYGGIWDPKENSMRRFDMDKRTALSMSPS